MALLVPKLDVTASLIALPHHQIRHLCRHDGIFFFALCTYAPNFFLRQRRGNVVQEGGGVSGLGAVRPPSN